MRHHLALVACLAFTGSLAHAGPSERAGRHGRASKKAKRKAKVALPVQPSASDEIEMEGEDVDERDEPDEDVREPRRRSRRPTREAMDDQDRNAAEAVFLDDDYNHDDHDDDRFDDDRAERTEPVDRPAQVSKAAKRSRAKNWHVAIGPYLWASAVDANVSLGPASVSAGVDFMDITRHARYGAEMLAEARYGRYSIYGDVLYGVVSLDGSKEVGPLMVTLEGTASSLMIDANAGYLLVGVDPHAKVSVEARAGVRYQRTAIAGAVNVSGADVSKPSYVDAAADALAGAQVVVRPFNRLFVSGTVDVGVVGDSSLTWSASADVGCHVTERLLLSLGWRTLTTDRPNVSIVMHGPRAAFQLTF